MESLRQEQLVTQKAWYREIGACCAAARGLVALIAVVLPNAPKLAISSHLTITSTPASVLPEITEV